MGVLNRPAVPCQAGPDRVRRPLEAERYEPRVAKQRVNPRRERTESEAIPWLQSRRRRPVLGGLAIVARSENDCAEAAGIVEDRGRPASEPQLNGRAGRDVIAV
jgi:hypothetical protein